MTPLECLKMLLNDGWLDIDHPQFAIYELKTMKTLGDMVKETISLAESKPETDATRLERERCIAEKNEIIHTKPYIVSLYSWGGESRCHDYKLSNGEIITLHEDEADAWRKK